jgi:hypothetical protein
VIYPTLEKGSEGGFEQGEREGNVVASPFTGGGLGQVECLGRSRPLAGKGVIPLKEGKREDNIAMPLLLKSIKDPPAFNGTKSKKLIIITCR